MRFLASCAYYPVYTVDLYPGHSKTAFLSDCHACEALHTCVSLDLSTSSLLSAASCLKLWSCTIQEDSHTDHWTSRLETELSWNTSLKSWHDDIENCVLSGSIKGVWLSNPEECCANWCIIKPTPHIMSPQCDQYPTSCLSPNQMSGQLLYVVSNASSDTSWQV